MAEQSTRTPAREVRGTAGYESPYPYLDRLQEKMEERLEHRVPVKGRFCGFCYGRLRDTDSVCGFCGTPTSERGTVDEIPPEVLRAFQARQKTEARWVHSGAFLGLLVASTLFVVIAVWGRGIPLWGPLAFLVLIGGGIVLAQLFGPLICGQIGYRSGTRKRDEAWARFLEERDGTPPPGANG
jgi:hypothetical protein